MALSGNKGEWSEIYVVLKLLADKKLFSADRDMQKIATVFYPILKILREEFKDSSKVEYVVNGNIKIIDGKTQDQLLEVSTREFIEQADAFFKILNEKKSSSFQMSEFEEFLNKIKIKTLKAKSEDKADISVIVQDNMTNSALPLTFSIKSLLGKNPTLLNPGKSTNFIYKISHPENKKLDISTFNKLTYSNTRQKGSSKISKRLSDLKEMGFQINFCEIESDNFQLNLELIDTDLPSILSHMLLYKYELGISKTSELLSKLQEENPLNYNLKKGHPFYIYKLSSLLYDYALGMTPQKVWKGNYMTTGGIIVVKNSGEALCYRIYDKNLFQEYLLLETKFEQPSTGEDENNPGNPATNSGSVNNDDEDIEDEAPNKKGKSKEYFFGWVYEENEEYFIKLNLQIRFLTQTKKKNGSNSLF